MGLDMYLTAERYLSEYDAETKNISDEMTRIAPAGDFRVKTIVYDIGYWRKATKTVWTIATRSMWSGRS